MSATPQNQDNQEIDLSLISKKIGDFFESISNSIFKGILFFKRNIVWIIILFILGVGLGIYLDKTTKVYDDEIIVIPNFGSTDYLYSKINLFNAKIKEKDTVFLLNLGIKNTKEIRKVEISPIVDVYKFISNKPENFDLIKLMAEDGDLNKIVKDELTSKNYPFHMIQISTSRKESIDEFITPFLKYLNNSDYFKIIQKEFVSNTEIKMRENDSIIKQINGFLNDFKANVNGTKSNNLVYYSENNQINDIIKTKDQLISEQGQHRLELVNYDKIVKEVSIVSNIENTKSINGKQKLILPFLFIGIFIMIGLFKSYYRNQMAKLNT